MSSGKSESSPVTVHVLDTVSGKPAQGITVEISDASKNTMGIEKTNENGRCDTILEKLIQNRPEKGAYKARFYTEEYWSKKDTIPFHPFVDVWFSILNTKEHYHIPLLITPASYTTYRGS
ncbi:hypothetical protein E3P89_01242 [Wallemia ichthyophaga]|uniref:5-hydroxyisourate hydrolase n=1 Tax=Wallemia ichthyophaga TaxID=245174 RepID=A0A4T0IUQ6_WALIC|nr:hypothetical protein E3P97_01707 [Wallemia ichthyophaga]TIB13457.1 hypothetical protein E3P90_01643 [Wallemia ichthyophaga]TIB15265.1 hypothetical protein E3P93_01393 [Wallemia ichthyophaga]TIB24044.1 hypothetical protein E3P89_01242 [Wallemia ichthyophaga]TIB25439.1 hypothetical protein E3P88_01597 [Wallemia ichthyophaga]